MSQDKMSCRQNVTGQNALQTKCHRTKCLADKMPLDRMSQDKMPCRQNATGQNALQTKCHRTKCLADKMSRDKMPCRQNVPRQNALQTKCHSDKMSCRQNVTRTKCHSEKMSLRQNVTQKNYHLLLNPSFAANKHRVGCIFFVLLQSLHGVMRGISSPLNFRSPPHICPGPP